MTESKITVNKAANTITVQLGGADRVLRWRSSEAAALETALEKDPLAFLASGGGETVFCQAAIIAGLSYDKQLKKELSPGTVYGWLDEAKDLDREELQKEVLYAVARGKTGAQAKRWVKVLDELFGPVAPGGEGPTQGG